MEIDQAIKLVLKKLTSELSRNGELVHFETKLQQRKQYDQQQIQYIQNQRLRTQLGHQYQSSDSEEQKENQYNNMSKTQLKRVLRKKLIEKKFDQDILEPIPDAINTPEQDNQEFVTTKNFDQAFSCADLKENELKSIKETKEVDDEDERQTNFGLYFFIKELEKLQKNKIGTNMLQSCKLDIAL